MSLHYLVKYECQKNGIILKYIYIYIYIAINDESQGNVAKKLKCDELLYYTFINHSAGKRIFKIGEHLARSYRQNG